MIDSDEIEVKAVISLNVLVLQMEKLGIIGKVEEKPLDMQKIRSMPGITVYMVKATDTMWDIAKRFYTTVEEICELNQLENDSLSEGQPLLLIKKQKYHKICIDNTVYKVQKRRELCVYGHLQKSIWVWIL